MNWWSRALAAGCSVLLIASCIPFAKDGPTARASLVDQVVVRGSIPAPAGGTYDVPVLVPGGAEVIVLFDPDWRSGWMNHLYAVKLDGSGTRRLPLPDDADCKFTSQHTAQFLPGGRLAYVQRCWVSLNPERVLPQGDKTLMVYDQATGRTDRLVPYYLNVNAQYFSFAPDGSRGIVNDGRGLNEHLRWLLPDRLETLALPFARVGYPSWSPDGKTITFDAAPDDKGRSGVALLDLPRKLYLMNADGTGVRPILDGFTNAGSASWSPDGHWLVLPLTFADGEDGLWLVEVATGRPYRLMSGERQAGGTAWLPDGRTIVVSVGIHAQYSANPPAKVGLEILELPDLGRIASKSRS